jgi:hypothetical protein
MIDGIFAGSVRFLALGAWTEAIASQFSLSAFGTRLDRSRSLDAALLLLLLLLLLVVSRRMAL